MKEKSIRNKKKTRKIIRNVIFWLLIAGFLAWFAALKLDLNSDPNTYDYVIPFESRDLNEYRSATGKVVMNDIETVSTNVTQKIKKVYFKLGDEVKEGDVLCEFDGEGIDEEIARIEKYISDKKSADALDNNEEAGTAEYQRKQAALQVESAQLAVNSARKMYDDTYNKYSEYFDKCYSTSNPEEAAMYEEMYNQYLSQLDGINDQIRAAEKTLSQARDAQRKVIDTLSSNDYIKSITDADAIIRDYEDQLQKLKDEKDHLIVKAPKSGIIADCFASEGGYAFDGGLFRIGTLGNYKVEAYVDSKDVLDIKPGQEAGFRTTLTGAEEIPAKVLKVSDIYSNTGDGYAVELEITDKSVMDKLRHNVATAAKIYLVNEGSRPSVQYDAIGEDENGNNYVYRAVKKGDEYVAEKVNIEKGYESSFYVEVKSDSLNEGDLIVGNVTTHNEGDRIKVKGMEG
ncbi:HlyD family efflux transporter periplasmic adaptor subunit [Ruminococcus sp. HUN007]|uniref:efflux RND transporter periplasmic adaptor subunit n=1 Tax=Ruminococcus sp. HUN007 TaxID=1514668 RepID=UPI0005D1B6B8|nr:HlyD family efflux transporter periplasmic adaptor subunit [Ruminococcus sp. HUN007]